MVKQLFVYNDVFSSQPCRRSCKKILPSLGVHHKHLQFKLQLFKYFIKWNQILQEWYSEGFMQRKAKILNFSRLEEKKNMTARSNSWCCLTKLLKSSFSTYGADRLGNLQESSMDHHPSD